MFITFDKSYFSPLTITHEYLSVTVIKNYNPDLLIDLR